MAYHEPLEDMIKMATAEVEADGWMHASQSSVHLAAFGYLVRENRRQQADLVDKIAEVLSAHVAEKKEETRSPRAIVKQAAPTAGIVGVLVAVVEVVKTIFLG